MIACHHHWVISGSFGQKVTGTCRHCKAIKAFDNQYNNERYIENRSQLINSFASEKQLLRSFVSYTMTNLDIDAKVWSPKG